MSCIVVMALLPLPAYFLHSSPPPAPPSSAAGTLCPPCASLGIRHSGEPQKVYCPLQEKESPWAWERAEQKVGWGGGGTAQGQMKSRKKQWFMDPGVLNVLELPLNGQPVLCPSSLPNLGLCFCLPLKCPSKSSNLSLMNQRVGV